MDRQLRDSIAASMHTGHELPPEPLLHSPEVVHELERDPARNQHIRAARVMDGNVEDQLIQEIEEPGKRAADESDGARVSSPFAGKIQAQRQLLREASQDVLSVVSAAVFADDEPHVGRMTRRRTFTGCRYHCPIQMRPSLSDAG
jgi:hypothetical protein